jgi:hypothetical protein
MPIMPTRTDESPTRQQDRASERGGTPHDEVSNFASDAGEERGVSDTESIWTDDPDINTHGSER